MKTADISVTLIDSMGSDLSVVNAARVSFDKESDWERFDYGKESAAFELRLKQSDEKLINYLAKHKHLSPFNHAFLSFRVKAPIFVARQLVKHEYMPWNEISRRYVDNEPEFYIPDTYRAKADNVKQGSGEDLKRSRYLELCNHDHCEASLEFYQEYLNEGVCPEQARMVLPQNVMTEWYWSGSLGAFLKMLGLRLDPHTQKETREVAQLIAKDVERLFPISYKARLN